MFDAFIGNEQVSIDVREFNKPSFRINSKYETVDPIFASFNREGEQSVGTVFWNISIGLSYKNDEGKKGKMSPSMILLHEVGHGFEVSKDGGKSVIWDANIRESGWSNVAERINIWNNDHPASEVLGIPLRSNHGGKQYKTSGVNSTLTPKEAKNLFKKKR